MAWLAALAVFVACGLLPQARGQFLRLGPFDFNAKLTTELIYTTNVELERESEAVGEREDFYIVVALDLVSTADVAPSTQVKLDTGVAIERHLNRTDLNNTENPLGRARISTVTEISRYTLSLEAGWERTFESSEDQAFPGSSRLTRREQENYGYSAELAWQADPLKFSALYEYEADRYLDEGEDIKDKDSLGYKLEGAWSITRRVDLTYSYDRTREELINVEEDIPEWELTQRILLKWTVTEKPKFVYGFGFEKEDVGEDPEDEGDWEVLHTFNLSDEHQINERVRIFYLITYELEEQEEDDDVTFTYSAGVDHEISRTADQSLVARKEPVDTFGSTTDTDSTRFTYDFEKRDLIMYNLNLGLTVQYQIDEPLDGGETEKIWTYTVELAHEVALSSRLNRRLEYLYTREDSNLEDELLEEHRVTLSFIYNF